MDWLRLYNSVLDDPKAQRLPGGLFKTWINLLCLASGAQVRGTLPTLADCAWRLRTDEDAMQAALAELEARGLIDVNDDGVWAIHDWSEYQYGSDNSTARVQKHRAKKKDEQERSDETLHETLPETESNVSVTAQNRTEQIQNRTEQSAPKSAQPKRKFRIPEDWEPNQTCRAVARELLISDQQFDAEMVKFKTHFEAKGELMLDWQKAAQNWLRRSQEFAPRSQVRTPPRPVYAADTQAY